MNTCQGILRVGSCEHDVRNGEGLALPTHSSEAALQFYWGWFPLWAIKDCRRKSTRVLTEQIVDLQSHCRWSPLVSRWCWHTIMAARARWWWQSGRSSTVVVVTIPSLVLVTLDHRGGDTKVPHQSPSSSLPPVDPVNNFPRVWDSAIDLPFLHAAQQTLPVYGKVGQSLDRLGRWRVWIDCPGWWRVEEVEGGGLMASPKAWIEAWPGSIGWRGKGFTKSPQTWHYLRQHQITSHYIECDKDPGMYRNPDQAAPQCFCFWSI